MGAVRIPPKRVAIPQIRYFLQGVVLPKLRPSQFTPYFFMDTHPLPSFPRAMEFLFAARHNVLSEELIEAYCRQGLLQEVEGRLVVTDEGRAALRRARRRPSLN
jgi:hypothetical protein